MAEWGSSVEGRLDTGNRGKLASMALEVAGMVPGMVSAEAQRGLAARSQERKGWAASSQTLIWLSSRADVMDRTHAGGAGANRATLSAN